MRELRAGDLHGPGSNREKAAENVPPGEQDFIGGQLWRWLLPTPTSFIYVLLRLKVYLANTTAAPHNYGAFV